MANRSASLTFRYSPEDKRRIRNALEQAGAPTETDWPRVHHATMQIARIVLRKAQADRLPYAGEASQRVARLVDALSKAATSYEALGDELQAVIESHHDLTLESEPLLLQYLSPADRPVLKKVLRGEGLVLLLKTVAESAVRVRDQLRAAGTSVELSSPLPSNLPRKVRDAVKQALRAKRRPFGNRFPASGAPKEEVVRAAIPRLWALYQQVTGQRPTIYPNAHDGATDGYDGKFYPFVKATLGPLRLVSPKSLPYAIYAAYEARLDAERPRRGK